jgi:hypothetical protein
MGINVSGSTSPFCIMLDCTGTFKSVHNGEFQREIRTSTMLMRGGRRSKYFSRAARTALSAPPPPPPAPLPPPVTSTTVLNSVSPCADDTHCELPNGPAKPSAQESSWRGMMEHSWLCYTPLPFLCRLSVIPCVGMTSPISDCVADVYSIHPQEREIISWLWNLDNSACCIAHVWRSFESIEPVVVTMTCVSPDCITCDVRSDSSALGCIPYIMGDSGGIAFSM